MVRAVLLMVFAIAAMSAGPVCAQRGTFSGKLVDIRGNPLAHKHLPFSGSGQFVETDELGNFSVVLLPGKYHVEVYVSPGSAEERYVTIKANAQTELTITGPQGIGEFEKASNREEVAPVPAPNGARTGPVVAEQLVPVDSMRVVYHPRSKPVRFQAMEFTVRYEMQEVGDSARVEVIAEGKNVTSSSINVCGCLSFWSTTFAIGPEQEGDIPLAPVRDWYKGPTLSVAPVDCNSRALDCTPTRLAAGETIQRAMSFAFRVSDFAAKTGELLIRSYFFSGPPGVAWEDARRVDLGMLAVPLRPVGTVGRYHF